ncbi:MAG: type II toxin-antitoxin system VapB family antitoxin [Endomicrobium sp.]|jgi:hypothetical protein|nr:type II toxin-antitoxin system VapB family antitoxin [Endomicrobium sp.]
MRTTLIINDGLLAEAMSPTKTSAINEALKFAIQVKKRKRLT